MDRNKSISSILPALNIEENGTKSTEESFMHSTLRPILKFQHTLIVSLFTAEVHLNHEMLSGANSTATEKRTYLTDFLQKNNKLKQQLIGVIVGLFSSDELITYLSMRKVVDKRITDMIITRYLSEFVD